MWAPSNKRLPQNTLHNSASFAKWICPDCQHEFGAIARDLISGKATCPYCNDRMPMPGMNTLADRYPEIAALWSKNNPRSVTTILPHISLPALWECPRCHGEYPALVSAMVSGKVECPYCTERRPLPGFNTFQVKHPDLMKEWMFVNNYLLADPDGILDTYSVPLWWNCPKGTKEFPHHYTMSPANRIVFQKRGREPCIYCKGRRRKKRHFI